MIPTMKEREKVARVEKIGPRPEVERMDIRLRVAREERIVILERAKEKTVTPEKVKEKKVKKEKEKEKVVIEKTRYTHRRVEARQRERKARKENRKVAMTMIPTMKER